MTAWEVTLGAWRELDGIDLVAGPPHTISLKIAAIEVALELEARLADGGAVALTPIETRVSDQHADHFIRNRVVVLGECRALVLRHPSPFPRIALFPRLAALVRLVTR